MYSKLVSLICYPYPTYGCSAEAGHYKEKNFAVHYLFQFTPHLQQLHILASQYFDLDIHSIFQHFKT